MTRAYETEASRAAVKSVAAILATLPLAVRADVVEEAFSGALPAAFPEWFREGWSNDPVAVLLIGGEIAADVVPRYEGDALPPGETFDLTLDEARARTWAKSLPATHAGALMVAELEDPCEWVTEIKGDRYAVRIRFHDGRTAWLASAAP